MQRRGGKGAAPIVFQDGRGAAVHLGGGRGSGEVSVDWAGKGAAPKILQDSSDELWYILSRVEGKRGVEGK